jgi:hypothetical protein
MANKTGYDAPQHERRDDFLGRWSFAADVFRGRPRNAQGLVGSAGDLRQMGGRKNGCQQEFVKTI